MAEIVKAERLAEDINDAEIEKLNNQIKELEQKIVDIIS